MRVWMAIFPMYRRRAVPFWNGWKARFCLVSRLCARTDPGNCLNRLVSQTVAPDGALNDKTLAGKIWRGFYVFGRFPVLRFTKGIGQTIKHIKGNML
jgi:hypothetical protein